MRLPSPTIPFAEDAERRDWSRPNNEREMFVAVSLFIKAFSKSGYEPAPVNAETHRSRRNLMP